MRFWIPNPLGPVRGLPRDLRLLFWSFFIWSFGYGLYNYIWSIFLRDLGADATQVGLVVSIGFLAAAATMIPGAFLANRYELRALLILGWALSIPVPLLYYFATTWMYVLPGIILLQASAFNIPAFNAYITGVGARHQTATKFGIVWAAAPLGFVFSPAAGGLLLEWISIREIFLLSFVLFTISTLVIFWMKTQPPLPDDGKRYKVEIPKSIPELTLLVILTAAAIAFSMASPYLPLFFQDVLRLAPNTIQDLGSVQALGQTVFAILLGRRADVRSRGGTIALGLLVSAAGLGGVLSTGNVFVVLPLVFLFGSARASSYVAYSILGAIKPGQSRAGQYGFYLTLETLGFVAGSYLGGYFYNVNHQTGFLVTIFLLLSVALIAGVMGFKPDGPPEPEAVTSS